MINYKKEYQQLCYTKKCRTKDFLDIIHNVSNSITLVQVMYTIGNRSHAFAVSGVCMFGEKHPKPFHQPYNI